MSESESKAKKDEEKDRYKGSVYFTPREKGEKTSKYARFKESGGFSGYVQAFFENPIKVITQRLKDPGALTIDVFGDLEKTADGSVRLKLTGYKTEEIQEVVPSLASILNSFLEEEEKRGVEVPKDLMVILSKFLEEATKDDEADQ